MIVTFIEYAVTDYNNNMKKKSHKTMIIKRYLFLLYFKLKFRSYSSIIFEAIFKFKVSSPFY